MKTVLVTGAYGFIGKNLCVVLENNNFITLKYGTHHTKEHLVSCVNKADVIVHLAGINRPENVDDFYSGNKVFTEYLSDLVSQSKKSTQIIYTSSTQASSDTDYGKSKKQAEEVLLKFHKKTNYPVSIFRLPNTFGKWSKPYYNSVVSTWCYNISRDMRLEINNLNQEIILSYIDDVVESIVFEINNQSNEYKFVEINKIYKVTLGELALKIKAFNLSRKNLIMPSLEEDFDRHLYSTYLTYLPENEYAYSLEMKHDNRGWLAEFIKSKSMGQIFISKTNPGITRGNHWHHSKAEKFLVLDGEAIIKFKNIEKEEVFSYEVNGMKLQVIDIPAGYSHSITNTGTKELITLFWANEIFNIEIPDTSFLEV